MGASTRGGGSSDSEQGLGDTVIPSKATGPTVSVKDTLQSVGVAEVYDAGESTAQTNCVAIYCPSMSAIGRGISDW